MLQQNFGASSKARALPVDPLKRLVDATTSASEDPTSHDAQLRQGAFDHVNRLAGLRDGLLEFRDLAAGFEFGGERIPLINPERGIFKPGKWSTS